MSFQVMAICSFFITPSTLCAILIPIESIDAVTERVRLLRARGVQAEDIGIIIDFHGVITNEETHGANLTLKDNIKTFLQFLNDEQSPFVIATAWDDFNAVIKEGVVELGLAEV